MHSTNSIFFILALVSMAAVVVSFVVGMVAMTKGQAKDHKQSNKMMQARVMFQALAIFFLFLAYVTK